MQCYTTHTVQCYTTQYSAVLYLSVQFSVKPLSKVEYYKTHYSSVLYHSVQFSLIPLSKVQCYTTQYSAVLYHSVKFSVIPLSTVQCYYSQQQNHYTWQAVLSPWHSMVRVLCCVVLCIGVSDRVCDQHCFNILPVNTQDDFSVLKTTAREINPEFGFSVTRLESIPGN